MLKFQSLITPDDDYPTLYDLDYAIMSEHFYNFRGYLYGNYYATGVAYLTLMRQVIRC